MRSPESPDEVIAAVVDHVAELVAVVDNTGVVLWVNAAVERILGRGAEEWVGRNAVELCHPDDIPLGLELLVSAQATGVGVKEPVIYRLSHADGSWVEMECIASNVELSTGELVLVVTGRPARQLRSPDAIFDEAAGRVQAMFEHAAIGMAQVSLQGRVLRANPQFGVIALGRPVELVGMRFAELVHPDDRDLVLGSDVSVLEGEGSAERQVRLLGANQGPRIVRLTSSLVRDHHGDPMYFALQMIDVTDLVSGAAPSPDHRAPGGVDHPVGRDARQARTNESASPRSTSTASGAC